MDYYQNGTPDKPLDYYQADKILKTKFGQRVLNKQSSGKGLMRSALESSAEGMFATSKKFSRIVDPMWLLKTIPGIGKHLAVSYGNLRGRSQSDINYFAGKKPKRDTASRITAVKNVEGLGGDATEVLTSMLTFMKSSREEDKRAREIRHNFEEEKATEEQRRHDELLKALGATKTAKPIKQPGQTGGANDSLFGTIMSAVKGLLSTLVSSIETMVKGLIAAALTSIDWLKNLKFLAKLSPNILSTLYKILTSPILRLLGGPLAMVGSILGLSWLLGEAVKMVPNMNALSPKEAANILTSGDWSDIENAGGEEKLRSIVKNGTEDAKRLLESGSDEEILQAGGIAKLKQTIQDGQIAMPTNAVPQMPETVTPRSKKNPGMATVWDQKYSKFFDPETGKRLTKDNFDDVEMKKLKRQNETAAPVTESVPSPTSLLSDLTEKYKELELNDMTGDVGNDVNIVSTTNNAAKLQDNPATMTASQRDDTAILNSILQSIKVKAH